MRAKGKAQAVELFELLHMTDLERLFAQRLEGRGVRFESTLECQDPDSLHHQPRVCISSDSGSFEVSIPAIALPRPLEISASSFGSL